MSFMSIFTTHEQWYVIEVRGSTDYIPSSVVGSLELPGGMTFEEGETVSHDTIEEWLLNSAEPPCTEEMATSIADEIWETISLQLHDYVSEGCGPIRKPDDLESITLKTAWGARYSAPGYLDCTDWCLGETEDEAVAKCKELYGSDDDEEDEEDDTNDDSDIRQWDSISETDDGLLVCSVEISLPSDLFEDDDRFADYAIESARESAPDYCVPAEWSAERLKGNPSEITFLVTRTSRKGN